MAPVNAVKSVMLRAFLRITGEKGSFFVRKDGYFVKMPVMSYKLEKDFIK